MNTPLTRAQARTWTIGAQGVALICVLAGVAFGIRGLPEHQPGASIEIARNNALPFQNTPGTTGNQNNSDTGSGFSIDTNGTAARFALLDNAPVPADTTPVEPVEEPDTEDTNGNTIDDANIIRRVKYIGFINDARTQHAFIRIDGKQRIVKRGEIAAAADDTLPDLEVLRITPAFIQLRDPENDSIAEVSLAAKTTTAVTMVNGTEVVSVEKPVEGESLLSAEEEAYIESLPPRQRQNTRRRLEREKRGLPPENLNRRPTPEALVEIRGGANNNSNGTDVRRREEPRDENE